MTYVHVVQLTISRDLSIEPQVNVDKSYIIIETLFFQYNSCKHSIMIFQKKILICNSFL